MTADANDARRRVWPRRWIVAAVAGAAVLAVAALVAVILLQRGRISSLEVIARQRLMFCLGQHSDVRYYVEHESVSKASHVRQFAFERLRHLYLGPSVLRLCVGNVHPVDTDEAEWCWIAKGDASCYNDVARKLLEHYDRAPLGD